MGGEQVGDAGLFRAERVFAVVIPDDFDAAVLYADSLMNVQPWQLWARDGKPLGNTEEIVRVLESVLKRNPRHIGANHLYIHAVEASKSPQRALPSARRLAGLAPGAGHLVHMPGHIYLPGRVGIVGRSGTLGYEAAEQLKMLGIGVSTSVGIGGDPINGSSHRDILEHFENDPGTDAVLMIGEIGGPQEAEAGMWSKANMKKPVVAYIAGLSAPKGRRMGHAGAIVSAFGESAAEKVDILAGCGVIIAPTPSEMGSTVASVLAKAK